MKIYTLLLGILLPGSISAQTVHDWENHHVLQINREPARAAFVPYSVQKRRLFHEFEWNLEIPVDSCSRTKNR